jgi:cytochrome b6-f complex iron-sulfur subunit
VPRVYLPVLDSNIDRRFVVRGIAAALVAGLLGCGTDHRPGDDDVAGGGDDGLGPDGGLSSTSPPSADASEPVSTGFMMCGPDLCFDLAATANASLRVVGGQRIVTLGSKRYLVIRTAADAFVALSAICTHAGCTVSYAKARNDVVCPCHGSTFALSGAVTNGPATLPLTSYDTSFDATSEILTVALA